MIVAHRITHLVGIAFHARKAASELTRRCSSTLLRLPVPKLVARVFNTCQVSEATTLVSNSEHSTLPRLHHHKLGITPEEAANRCGLFYGKLPDQIRMEHPSQKTTLPRLFTGPIPSGTATLPSHKQLSRDTAVLQTRDLEGRTMTHCVWTLVSLNPHLPGQRDPHRM